MVPAPGRENGESIDKPPHVKARRPVAQELLFDTYMIVSWVDIELFSCPGSSIPDIGH